MKPKHWIGKYNCLTAWLVLVWSVPSQALSCRLALVLAIDVSVSIDQHDYALQRDGLAAALRAPEVVDAFLSSHSPVAVAAYEWSGPYLARTVLDWIVVTSRNDLDLAAERIEDTVRAWSGSTSIGNALVFGAELFEQAPSCAHQTLDLSVDGLNNEGVHPYSVYNSGVYGRTTVNALAIGGELPLDEFVEYLTQNVIRGPGSFVEVAYDHYDVEAALRRKLVREVTTLAISSSDATSTPVEIR